jgi:membrane-associated phospholipid phosphatase
MLSFKFKDWFSSQSDHPVLMPPMRGMVLCALFGAGFILATTLHYLLTNLDQQTEIWIFSGTIQAGHALFNKITLLGESILIVPISLMFVAWWSGRKEWDKVGGLILTVFGGGFLAFLFKLLFHSPRPNLYTGVINELNFGFPSGHAVMSLLFWGYLAYLLVKTAPSMAVQRWAPFWAGGITFSVGLSRLFLGVHYPLDVLGGWMLGAMWMTFSILVMDYGVDQKPGFTTVFRFLRP